METVVGPASLALSGGVSLGPEVSTELSAADGRLTTRVSAGLSWAACLTRSGSDPSPLVLTVLRLLSTAEAVAVFLFASARSRSSMVSCATSTTSGFLSDLRQPTPPAINARQTATGS